MDIKIEKSVVNHKKNYDIHGPVINIDSVNGDAILAKNDSVYSVSKAAIMRQAKVFVTEPSPHKVRINCVSSDWFRTPMNEPKIEQIIPFISQGDIEEPSDLDGLILYFASNDASTYVTDTTFAIGGGASWGVKSW